MHRNETNSLPEFLAFLACQTIQAYVASSDPEEISLDLWVSQIQTLTQEPKYLSDFLASSLGLMLDKSATYRLRILNQTPVKIIDSLGLIFEAQICTNAAMEMLIYWTALHDESVRINMAVAAFRLKNLQYCPEYRRYCFSRLCEEDLEKLERMERRFKRSRFDVADRILHACGIYDH